MEAGQLAPLPNAFACSAIGGWRRRDWTCCPICLHRIRRSESLTVEISGSHSKSPAISSGRRTKGAKLHYCLVSSTIRYNSHFRAPLLRKDFRPLVVSVDICNLIASARSLLNATHTRLDSFQVKKTALICAGIKAKGYGPHGVDVAPRDYESGSSQGNGNLAR
jgi:hypothetical protein